jgi:hypothetical protein
MTMLKDVLAELIGMFLGDARLTLATLSVAAVAASLIKLAKIEPLVGGGVLLVGCLLVLVEAVRRSGRRTKAN